MIDHSPDRYIVLWRADDTDAADVAEGPYTEAEAFQVRSQLLDTGEASNAGIVKHRRRRLPAKRGHVPPPARP